MKEGNGPSVTMRLTELPRNSESEVIVVNSQLNTDSDRLDSLITGHESNLVDTEELTGLDR